MSGINSLLRQEFTREQALHPMSSMNREERDELVDMVAQAVIDKIEERDRINGLAEMVIQRVLALQTEEAELQAQEREQDS